MTEWIRPASVDDALAARAAHPDSTLLAGGTDLMVGDNIGAPPGVIDLFGLDGLTGIADADGGVRIGAAATFADILASELVAERAPLLAAAAREIGALQIQARGTIGGNVGTSSPVGDSLPALMALDAVVELASSQGRRELPYADFCTGYRTTALAADELIVAVRIPPTDGLRQFWRKVGTRRAQSISKVAMAAAARLDGGAIVHVRIAFAAVKERPVRALETERAIIGGWNPDSVAAAVAKDISPIDDVRSTADYRSAVAANLVRRFLTWLG